MNRNDDQLGDYLYRQTHAGRSIESSSFSKTFREIDSMRYIRFEYKYERYYWVHADDICFVKSADHYVKALIKYDNRFYWMTRHSTLKELLELLPANCFIRLNKFYLLNLHSFSHFNQKQKLLFFKDDVSIAVPHRISPFVRQLLETNYT